MKINEVAKLTGVTVRTLHYYDEIGLLAPSELTETGYRLYNDDAILTLQQILFFRELDFPLNEIKEIITNPSYNQTDAFSKQKELLIKKRDRLDGLIGLLEKTMKGDKTMSFKEFDMSEIEKSKKKYAKEVKERWGNTDAYVESKAKTDNYGAEQWEQITAEGAEILKEFASHMDQSPDSEEVQSLVKKWQNYITARFYHCTDEILSGLGMMYIGDERFTKNIDQNGEGTSKFIAIAIEIYCAK